MLSQQFVWLASALVVLGNLLYLRDTLRGTTKPNRVTALLWGVAPLITYAAQTKGHAGQQAWYTLVIGILPLVILLASFANKQAYWRITRFDLACGALSFLALIALFTVHNPMVALGLSILADFTAGTPTIIKSYRYPNTETTAAYALEVISSVIVILTIHDWRPVNYLFAVYILLMNILFTGLLVFSPRRQGCSEPQQGSLNNPQGV
jgi:hypothetical protein